jgi:hypothetical protein
MPVLTRKQYEKEKALCNLSPSPNRPEIAPDAGSLPASGAPGYEYVIMYPEIPSSGNAPSFDGVAESNGKKIPYKCIRGIIRTENKEVFDFLVMKRQHILLERKEKKGDSR